MFRTDFYVDYARLLIEINGVQHFYPYTRKPHQFTTFKNKVLRGNQKQHSSNNSTYNLLNLNTHLLEGLSKTPENLVSFLRKTIDDYKSKL
jgi:very-short-patch-repair endonuclease